MQYKQNRVKIVSDGLHDKLYLDGVKISNMCTGYTLSHHVGELPELELDLIAFPMVAELDTCKLAIKALENLASCFDREQFEKFCDIWNSNNTKSMQEIELTDEEKQILAIADKYLVMSIHNNLWE